MVAFECLRVCAFVWFDDVCMCDVRNLIVNSVYNVHNYEYLVCVAIF